MIQPQRLWQAFASLVILLALGLLIAACGPAVPPAEETVTEDSEDVVQREPEITDVDIPRAPAGNNLAIDADTLEYDANDIPVGLTADGHAFRGSPDAPVVIEEFSDFQCPFCARFHKQTLPLLDANQIANGEVVFIYKDFPLTNIHPYATAAANAARCAGEQSAVAYWEMHDKLFEVIQEWSNARAESVFTRYGEEIGLEMESFTACMAEERYFDAIQADLTSGRARGVTSTPSFFINDQLLVGAQPISVFNQAIETVVSGEAIPPDPRSAPPGQPTEAIAAPTPVALSPDYAASLGDPEAPVTIVEFSDYQCPFCRRHSMETMPHIISAMVETGRVHYIFKDLPLDNIHPEARQAAAAARCAGEQDAYWEMHDLIFVEQSAWSGQPEQIPALFISFAEQLSLNKSEFEACLASGRYDAAIQANLDEALSLGINGTPFFYVNGYPLNGALPAEVFEFVVVLAEEGELGNAIAEALTEQERQRQQQQQQRQQPARADVPLGDAFMIGRRDAPITIVEFTDFQCSFCQRHAMQTFPLIMEKYIETGVVRYVFKDFPLTNIHPQAVKAAESARCALEQEAFMEMHHVLFVNQEEWSGDSNAPEQFVAYAGEIGLDTTAFRQCLESGRHEAAVLSDMEEGIQLGVTGTPAFFLNGYMISGAYPIEAFDQAIETLLSGELDE